MPQLRILDLPGRGIFDIDVAAGGLIGREAGVAIQIEHPTVSRQHAQLVLSGAQMVLIDMGSANGTRVNGVKITGPQTLREGDSVELGKVNAIYFNKHAPTAIAALPKTTAGKISPSMVTSSTRESQDESPVAHVPLERVEDLLAGLLEILTKPRPLAERAQHVSNIFLAMLPS